MDTQQPRDEQLWKKARQRAEFKSTLMTYLWVNIVLWGIWWFTHGRNHDLRGIPWPAYVSFFWGIGLVFEYFRVYGFSKEDMAEKEYRKLKERGE